MPTTLSVFPFVPTHPYTRKRIDPTAIASFSGSPLTSRASFLDRDLFAFAWSGRFTLANLETLEAFWVARRGPVGLFYFKDPIGNPRTSASLGTAIAAQTVFPLPTGAYRGEFPIDNGTAILYADGSPVTIASVDTDGRSVTASSAPGVGKVMTLTYQHYRKVRFATEELDIQTPAVGTYDVPIALLEEAA